MRISVVVPVYNGSKTIGSLIDELKSNLSSAYDLEIILVNDASKDNSADICKDIVRRYPRIVKFINLSRNFGEHAAVIAGLNYATGEYSVIIDDDFQNPPSEIIKIIKKIEEGYDVVYTAYKEKRDSWFRNLGSKFNDKVANIMLGKPKGLYLSSFKVMNSLIREKVVEYKGPFPYIDGIILTITRNIASVKVEHRERKEGKSNYTFKKLVSLWSNMFTNFSILPLRLAIYMGLVFSIIGFLLGVSFVIERIVFNILPRGYAVLAVSIVTFSGVQLFALGMIGEYIGRLFLSHNRLPQFVIREKYGFEK